MDLIDPISGYILPTDPQTGEQYSYEVTGASSFKLCGFFNTDSRYADAPPIVKPAAYIDGVETDNWLHTVGAVCFDRTIDPERYPTFEKPMPVR